MRKIFFFVVMISVCYPLLAQCAIPEPQRQEWHKYEPVVEPRQDSLMRFCQPIGVGWISEGVGKLEIAVPEFQYEADVYLVVYAPAVNKEYYLITNTGLIRASQDLKPFIANTKGGEREIVLPEFDLSSLPQGEYYFFLVAVKAGTHDFSRAVIWETSFSLPASPAQPSSVGFAPAPSVEITMVEPEITVGRLLTLEVVVKSLQPVQYVDLLINGKLAERKVGTSKSYYIFKTSSVPEGAHELEVRAWVGGRAIYSGLRSLVVDPAVRAKALAELREEPALFPEGVNRFVGQIFRVVLNPSLASDIKLSTLEKATAKWRAYSGLEFEVSVGEQDYAPRSQVDDGLIHVAHEYFSKIAGTAFTLLNQADPYTETTGVILVNKGYSQDIYLVLLAHEFGHILALGEGRHPNTIMYQGSYQTTVIHPVDAEKAKVLYWEVSVGEPLPRQ